MHKENVHGEKKPYKCEICDKNFAQNYYVKSHAAIHLDIKPFLCQLCNYSNAWKSELKRLMTKVHQGINVSSEEK